MPAAFNAARSMPAAFKGSMSAVFNAARSRVQCFGFNVSSFEKLAMLFSLNH
jgi:hypothetical protein